MEWKRKAGPVRRPGIRREPSLHQVQMRRWVVTLVVISLLAFAGLFYLLSRLSAAL